MSPRQGGLQSIALELPYLTGQSPYPPPDPTVGVALAMMSRTFPSGPIDLRPHVTALDLPEAQEFLNGWRVISMPGHTPGHVSFYRASDGALIAGDALATMDQESWTKTVTMPREARWPPAPLTTDWPEAIKSIQRLSELWPSVIAAGHGLRLAGNAAAVLREFSNRVALAARRRSA